MLKIVDGSGFTLIHQAVFRNSYLILKILLDHVRNSTTNIPPFLVQKILIKWVEPKLGKVISFEVLGE